MRTLNLGILAHVDAGKTSLTERLLYAAGVIDEIGSVDDGSTQTDSLALERQRGITIKSAVVSFVIDDVDGQPDRHARPPGLHRRGGAGAERARRRGAGDLRRRRRAGADARADADAAAAAHPDAPLREQDRPRRRASPSACSADDRREADAGDHRDGLGARRRHARTRDSRRTATNDVAFAAELAELLADHDDALLAAYVDDPTAVPYAGSATSSRRRPRGRSSIRCSSARRSRAPAWTR